MTESKMKIMHFVHSLNEGGIERLLLDLCKKIDKNKFEIQVCCLVEKGSMAHEYENAGIKLHYVNARRDLKFKNFIPNFFVIFRIVKLLKKEKICITHGHEFFSTVFSRIAGLLAGVNKRYVTFHNVYTWWGKGVHK
ncbi:MAG: glycosyltransferase, partial [Ignavibacteria bacterium]